MKHDLDAHIIDVTSDKNREEVIQQLQAFVAMRKNFIEYQQMPLIVEHHKAIKARKIQK